MTVSACVSRLCFLQVCLLVSLPHAFAQPGVAFAQVAVAGGQSVAVNAVNLGTGTYPQGSSCSVTLQVLGGQGQVLASNTATLAPGNASSLVISRGELPPGPDRLPVRAVLLFGYSGGANPPAALLSQYDCNIVPSLEIFDNDSGKTRIVVATVTPLPRTTPPSQ